MKKGIKGGSRGRFLGGGWSMASSSLGHLLGLLRVRVVRGVNLAVRDVRSSDPYVVLKMGKQVFGSGSGTPIKKKEGKTTLSLFLFFSFKCECVLINLRLIRKFCASILPRRKEKNQKRGCHETTVGKRRRKSRLKDSV